MAQLVRDVMTPNPLTLDATSSIQDAARAMREKDIGNIIVMNDGALTGIVTDRDITVRAVADGRDPSSTKLADICSGDLVCVTPQDNAVDAVDLMREKAVRRLPVVDGKRPVGVVSIGDLAVERDPTSALADISAAPGNT